jgi:hypothetical protein
VDSIDARLEAMLLEPEPAIGNDGFSETVMAAVRATKLCDARTTRWTLTGAIVAGTVITSLIAAPLNGAFSSWLPGSDYATSALAVLFVAFVAIAAAWVFYSE